MAFNLGARNLKGLVYLGPVEACISRERSNSAAAGRLHIIGSHRERDNWTKLSQPAVTGS